jgi:hypothetical protein
VVTVMVESPAQPPQPWLYPYREDPRETRLSGEPVFRPFVCVSLANGEEHTALLDGLVATAASGVYASAELAEALGIDLSDHEGEVEAVVNGSDRTVTVRYKTLTLRLHPSDGSEDVYRQWQTKVGFIENWHRYVVLGNVGFLDRFRVTFGGSSKAVAIELPSPLESAAALS